MNTEITTACRKTPQSGRDNGFSLIEVLLSLVILTVVMLLTINLMMSQIRGNHSGRLFTVSSSITTDMVEKLMEVDYENLVDFDGYNTGLTPPGVEPALSYCGEWQQGIHDMLPGGYGEINIQYGANLSRIEVVVRFMEGDVEHEVKLETMRNSVL